MEALPPFVPWRSAAARGEILERAITRLEELRTNDSGPFNDVYDDVAQHYRARLSTLRGEGSDEHGTATAHARLHDAISRDLIRLERSIAIEMRNQGRISDDALRHVLYELDLDETRRAAG